MKTLQVATIGVFMLALTACPPADRPVDEEREEPVDTPAVEVGHEETVNLSEVHDSRVSGQATLIALNGETEVLIEVDADEERADAQVHAGIYRDRCDDARDRAEHEGMDMDDDADNDARDDAMAQTAEQVEDLQMVTLDAEGRGMESVTVQRSLGDLMDGMHSVQLHVDNTLAACGDISEANGAMGW